jgi:hypothetical protein
MWAAYSAIALGWSSVMRSAGAERGEANAVNGMLAGLDALQASGTGLLRPHLLGWLADAQVHLGQHRDGMQTLDEAFETIERTGERWCAARLRLVEEGLRSTAFTTRG